MKSLFLFNSKSVEQIRSFVLRPEINFIDYHSESTQNFKLWKYHSKLQRKLFYSSLQFLHFKKVEMSFARPEGNKPVKYGTAGFRGPASNGEMDFVVYRTGVLAALRSRCLGKTTGLMITASHNPIQERIVYHNLFYSGI